MSVADVLVFAALALSIISIALTSAVLLRIYDYVKMLVEEFGITAVTHKRYRRIKRYILVKFLCLEDYDNYKLLVNHVRGSVYALLGPLLKHKCGIDVISYKPSSKRAIVRVRGEAFCVIYTLLALSIQHLGKEPGKCIVIPIRTSGLISRLRRRYLKN